MPLLPNALPLPLWRVLFLWFFLCCLLVQAMWCTPWPLFCKWIHSSENTQKWSQWSKQSQTTYILPWWTILRTWCWHLSIYVPLLFISHLIYNFLLSSLLVTELVTVLFFQWFNIPDTIYALSRLYRKVVQLNQHLWQFSFPPLTVKAFIHCLRLES